MIPFLFCAYVVFEIMSKPVVLLVLDTRTAILDMKGCNRQYSFLRSVQVRLIP